MYVKMYFVNDDKQMFERDGVITGVTSAMVEAAKKVARLDMSLDGTMCADVHDDRGDIVDVLVFTRQMRDRVIAELRIKQ